MSYKLTINSHDFTDRPNHAPGPGGALNAGYTPVDALAFVSNLLGQHGIEYRTDFIWHRFEYTTDNKKLEQNLVLTFTNHDAMLNAKLVIESIK